jgi:hypothetical protein
MKPARVATYRSAFSTLATPAIMRTKLILAILGLVGGFTAMELSGAEVTPKPATRQPDPIEALVDRLSSSHGMWTNGMFPKLDLPATASAEQVVARVFKMISFDKGRVKSHRILETREIRIRGPLPDTYTALLVDTDFGRKIVLLQYTSPSVGWWSRVFDE